MIEPRGSEKANEEPTSRRCATDVSPRPGAVALTKGTKAAGGYTGHSGGLRAPEGGQVRREGTQGRPGRGKVLPSPVG